MTGINLRGLILRLIDLPHETEWVEFKRDNGSPEEIGEYLSAIANSAALHGKDSGFIVWGVADGTHDPVGTAFKPRKTRVGNEELESWLSHLLTPRIDFRIHELQFGGRPIVLFDVPAASHTPVRFKENEWIRVGSYKKKLKEYVSNRQMTNATLRERFSISDKNYSIASRIIAETLEAGLIKPHDPENRSRKHARYLPFWAQLLCDGHVIASSPRGGDDLVRSLESVTTVWGSM